MGKATVTFDLRKGTIEVAGSSEDLSALFEAVRSAAPSLKHVRIIASDPSEIAPPDPTREAHDPSEQSDADEPPRAVRRSPVGFARRFEVTTASQRIAVLAYGAIHEVGRVSFSVEDMERWFRKCGFKSPGAMAMAMADARRKSKFIENRGRNQWVITPKGEAFVRALMEAQEEEASS